MFKNRFVATLLVPAVGFSLFTAPLFAQKKKTAPKASPTKEAPSFFENQGYEATLKKAKETGKFIFIDFYAVWCGPCHKLDETTWQDDRVKKMLTEKAIPLRIDAEAEEKLAAQFKVEAYPTLVFLRSDGTELDRLVGYYAPDQFLTEAGDILTGKDAVTRAREKVEKGEPDYPANRFELGKAYQRANRPAEALVEFLWCLDFGVAEDSNFGENRSEVLEAIQTLGKTHPPAIAALKQRRNTLEGTILTGEPTRRDIDEYLEFNGTVDETDRNLNVFKKLKEAGANKSRATRKFGQAIRGELIEARLYKDARPYFDHLDATLEVLQETHAKVQELAAEYKAEKAGQDMDAFYSQMRRALGGLLENADNNIEVRLAFGEVEDAERLLKARLKLDGSPDGYAAVIERAVRAENLATARKLAAEALKAHPKEGEKFEMALKTKPEEK